MDKEIEHERYNNKSALKVKKLQQQLNFTLSEGSAAYPSYLKSPYIFYENLLKKLIKPGFSILDLCCGDGVHTIPLARLHANVTAIDIAENSIKLAEIRARREKQEMRIKFIVSDVENLPFGDNDKFDMITCVGSLSYMELQPFLDRIKKLLNESGMFICVDSFNYNPIYRINRYVHYLRGERSFSTLKRMPNKNTIKVLKTNFKNLEIHYFGIFAFLGCFLKFLFGSSFSKKVVDKLDDYFSIFRVMSFKIVVVVKK